MNRSVALILGGSAVLCTAIVAGVFGNEPDMFGVGMLGLFMVLGGAAL